MAPRRLLNERRRLQNRFAQRRFRAKKENEKNTKVKRNRRSIVETRKNLNITDFSEIKAIRQGHAFQALSNEYEHSLYVEMGAEYEDNSTIENIQDTDLNLYAPKKRRETEHFTELFCQNANEICEVFPDPSLQTQQENLEAFARTTLCSSLICVDPKSVLNHQPDLSLDQRKDDPVIMTQPTLWERIATVSLASDTDSSSRLINNEWKQSYENNLLIPVIESTSTYKPDLTEGDRVYFSQAMQPKEDSARSKMTTRYNIQANNTTSKGWSDFCNNSGLDCHMTRAFIALQESKRKDIFIEHACKIQEISHLLHKKIEKNSQKEIGMDTEYDTVKTWMWNHFSTKIQPTQIQLAFKHQHYIDTIIPWKTMKDRIILFSDILFQPEHLLAELTESELCPKKQFFSIRGNDLTDETAWEISEAFVHSWWFLIDHHMLKQTNWWREQRAEQPILEDRIIS